MAKYSLIFGAVPIKYYIKKVKIGWICITRIAGDKEYSREWTPFKPYFI